MLTRKTISALMAMLCLISSSLAQEKIPIKFGKVEKQDFEVNSHLIDSSTYAVVVADVGKSIFISNPSEQTFSLVFKQKKRIKILHKNGFDAATIIIPLYVSDNKAEELQDLDAYTYNVENGKVVQTRVEKSSIYTEKQNKNWVHKKFTFPALKEGSIIEYSYQVKSDFFFNLQPWIFQGQFPVLWSQYEAAVPDFFKYVTLLQGYHPFLISKKQHSNVQYNFTEHVERERSRPGVQVTSAINNFKLDGILEQSTWVMKDVPALKEETFTTTVRNAISKIEFQLNQVAFPNTHPTNYLESWEKVAEDLYQNEKFGGQIGRPNNWLDNDVEAIVGSASSQTQKAELIFAYVRDNFTFNGQTGIFTNTTLKDVLRNKSGSIADINLLLIAMLNTQKILAAPVILSTRDHGFAHVFYPLINRYNYVVAKVTVDNKAYFLDASTKYLPFGQLPGQVYNGQAREIHRTFADPVNFSADSLKETTLTSVFLSNTDGRSMSGRYTQNMGPNHSLSLRTMMANTSMEQLKKKLQNDLSEDMMITNLQVDSLKLLAKPVGVKFDFDIKSMTEDIIYFSPMLGEALKTNPFRAAERFYPVEMPYTKDDIFVLYMEIPKGYKVDELPKSVRLKFNEDEGMFEYLISADQTNIQLRTRLMFNKATFTNEDYQSLRELYTFIVKKQAEHIVFKKEK